VVVTDDFEMSGIRMLFSPGEAAVRAIEAGADVVLCVRLKPAQTDSVEEIRRSLLSAVREGRIARERIDQSVERVLTLKRRVDTESASGRSIDEIAGADHQRALADLITD
jgi:beta-N-acetylhexosaminidase